MVITDNLIAEIDKYLKNTLSAKRYRHCVSTAETAEKLCVTFGYDNRKGYLAGLLHDIARELDKKEMLDKSLLDGSGMSLAEKDDTVLLHGRAGAYLSCELFGIKDNEILQAIKLHTTGGAGMGAIAKIVFVADYIEPNRKHITSAYLKSLEDISLDNMVTIVLHSVLDYLEKEKKIISEKTLELLEELENAREK